MSDATRKDTCARIAKLRLETEGPRGKSAFAKKLGLSPSTYDYYEATRVPPADVLVRIADLTGADLRWLLTGKVGHGPAISTEHPALRRAAALLADRPNAAGPLAAFIDILAESQQFPAKAAAAAPPAEATPAKSRATAKARARPARAAPAKVAKASWLPVLGRSAAGIPHFWADADEAAGVITLEELIARQATSAQQSSRQATAADNETDQTRDVQIVTLRAPDENDVVEFIAAEAIKARHPDAFALRIDGDSMSPDIAHGDLVILSPVAQAADGRPAVVQLKGQIGVTCKLYRRAGKLVHLVPINEQYEVQTFPADHCVWALRVLAKVR